MLDISIKSATFPTFRILTDDKCRATIHLLNTSIVVAISGGLRLYVAFLLAGKEPDLSTSIAMSLIVYSTYTLDRTVKNKEDEINRTGEKNACKSIAFFTVCVSFLATVLILTPIFVKCLCFIIEPRPEYPKAKFFVA